MENKARVLLLVARGAVNQAIRHRDSLGAYAFTQRALTSTHRAHLTSLQNMHPYTSTLYSQAQLEALKRQN